MSLRRADETNGRGQSRNGVTGHRGNVGAAISDGDRLLEVLRVGLEQKLSVSQGDSVGVKTGGVDGTGGVKNRPQGPDTLQQGGVKWASSIAPGYPSSHKATTTTNQPSAQQLPKVIKKGLSLQDRIDRLAGTLEPEVKKKLLKCVRNLNKWQGECARLVEQYEAKRPVEQYEAKRPGLEGGAYSIGLDDALNILEQEPELPVLSEEDEAMLRDMMTPSDLELQQTADEAGSGRGEASGSKDPSGMLPPSHLAKQIEEQRKRSGGNLDNLDMLHSLPGADDPDELFFLNRLT